MQLPIVRFLQLCMTLAITGCATTPAVKTPPTPANAHRDSTKTVEPTTWALHVQPGSWRYDVTTNANVTLTSDSTAVPVTVGSVISYSFTIDTTNGRQLLKGRIDSSVVTTGNKVPTTGNDTSHIQFTGMISPNGRIDTITTSEITRCKTGMEPSVASVYGIFISFPQMIAVGSTWQDTTAVVTCRGDVPITTTTIHIYHVSKATEQQGNTVLEIQQTGTVTIENKKDSTRKNGMVITGHGTLNGMLEVIAQTGTLLHATRESHTSLTITTPRSILPFQQDARETVALRQ